MRDAAYTRTAKDLEVGGTVAESPHREGWKRTIGRQPADLVAVPTSWDRPLATNQPGNCGQPPGGPDLGPEEIVGGPAAGDGSGLDLAARAELAQNTSYVAAQCAHRDVHFAGHLRGALARHDPLQHLSFTRREPPEHLLRR